ncbi:2Fe-2S iron-sulfur cluster-binding protein [Leptospira sp. FAT2]|uniref:2Fe-2S iron-sulfur cluster-binding protein n=1 Tax=Leptospira sanjuanensis TaxID=2879643 RepID=UPI001EE8FAFF|nr:2Fe-2S iron-sulfur cluster-binding protein [Leptospira sanjuanensis]MCG6192316.1 2Fe-2S iron-sulfur cluster-binding protein [Leptospira sanjuanensis]
MKHQIYFPNWNRSIEALEEENILDSSLRSGVDLSYSCRAGRCGACKIILLEGQVEHLSHNQFALTEEEKEKGYILACRSIPKSDLSLRRIDTQSN